ncbi:MAG TPA: thiamine-phosphate kinase [Candidatus Thermoplasmatota archaeon]|nr:thiamine-phosphate kinase [Candidatus Thermoplasmatota archaeon]
MDLRELGERAAIRRMVAHFPTRLNALAFGDDCAAVPLGDQYLLLTTDAVAEPTHFPRGATPYERGWFAAAVNLSDIAAKGGEPLGLLLAMGLPPTLDAAFLDDLARGAADCAAQAGAEILGGDTKQNPTLTITGTAIGLVPKGELLRRAGAKAGDLIAVTGPLGGAGADYFARLAGTVSPGGRLLHPTPRVREGRALAKGGAHASLDLSDGLALGLYDMAEAAGLGFEVEAGKVPLHPQATADPQGAAWAFHFGGDYELLAAVPPDRWDVIAAAVRAAGGQLHAIGRFTPPGAHHLVAADGSKQVLPRRGWEHFRS